MSKKRKGLSLEEKRNVLLSIYHDKKEPFNLKEIENLGSKKGVVSQTIKDVNQSLVDDFLVQTDKIGAANFFWSFPSKAYQDLKVRKEQQESTIQRQILTIQGIDDQIQEASMKRRADGRALKLERLRELRLRKAELDKELESLKFNDPAEIKKVQVASTTNKEACDRWTDNVFVIKSFLTKKKGLSSKEADRILKIDSSFDYPEYQPGTQKQRVH